MLLPPIEAIHVGEKFTNAALHQERSSLWNVGTSVMGTESLSNQEVLAMDLHFTETGILTCEGELGICFKPGSRSKELAYEHPSSKFLGILCRMAL